MLTPAGFAPEPRVESDHTNMSRASDEPGVHAGDRLPWFAQTGDGADDNFAPLRSRWWQAHVYGDAKPGLGAVRAACERRGIAVVQLPWRAAAGEVGLEAGALYLVRPDGHLAFVDPKCRVDAFEAYISRVLC